MTGLDDMRRELREKYEGLMTDEEKKALERLGLRYGGNFAVISPQDRKYYLKSWGVIC